MVAKKIAAKTTATANRKLDNTKRERQNPAQTANLFASHFILVCFSEEAVWF